MAVLKRLHSEPRKRRVENLERESQMCFSKLGVLHKTWSQMLRWCVETVDD